MVIFNSYVKLPESIYSLPMFAPQMAISMGTVGQSWLSAQDFWGTWKSLDVKAMEWSI